MKTLMKFMLCMILCALCVLPVLAQSTQSTSHADALNSLGLFSGTDKGYELENKATRVQTAVTFARLLGKEQKANAQKNPHPFKDVPAWASHCIGYLYEEYLVNGVSDTAFGSNNVATPDQFTTMLLRALGYSDSGDKADFTYSMAVNYAFAIGMIDQAFKTQLDNTKELTRGQMVSLSYYALKTPLKNSYKTLSQKLCYEQRVFTEDKAIKAGVMEKYTTKSYFAGIEVIHPSFTIEAIGSDLVCTMQSPLETFGLTLYVSADDGEFEELAMGLDWEFTSAYYNPQGAQMLNSFAVHSYPDFKDSLTFAILKKTSKTYLAKFNGMTPFVTYRR